MNVRVVSLLPSVTETLRAWGRPYEIIVIDDGSTDDSFPILAHLQKLHQEGRVRPADGGWERLT